MRKHFCEVHKQLLLILQKPSQSLPTLKKVVPKNTFVDVGRGVEMLLPFFRPSPPGASLPPVSPDVAGAAARVGGLCLTRLDFLRRRALRREHPRKRQDTRPPECLRTQGVAPERGLPRAAEAQGGALLKDRNHGKPTWSAGRGSEAWGAQGARF